MFSFGSSFGWLSTVLDVLQSENTPLVTGPISVTQLSGIGALPHFVSFFVVYLYLISAKYIGFKMIILLTGFPQLLSWIIIITTNQVGYLLLSRALTGLCIAGALTFIPMYTADIAEASIRGTLVASTTAYFYLGLIWTHSLSIFFAYSTALYVQLVPPILFLCTFAFMPHTPQFYLRKGQELQAEKSLRFFRNHRKNCIEDDEKIQFELKNMKQFIHDLDVKEKLCIKDFTNSEALIGVFAAVCICVLMAFNGNVVIISYSWNVFHDSGSNFSPKVASLIVSSFQCVGSILSTILVDIIGRRWLLLLSTFFCTISLAIFGGYNYLALQGMDVNGVYWVPVLCMSIALFSATIGLIPVAVVLLPELLPTKIRHSCSIIGFSFMLLFFCIAIGLYPFLVANFHMYVCIWIFATICFLGFLYALFIVKETIGKNLNQMK